MEINCGRLQAARESLLKASGLFQTTENSRYVGKALYNLAEIALYQGEFKECERYCQKAFEIFEKLQLQHPVVIMELQVEKLFEWYKPQKQYTPPPAYPSIFRDMSLVMDKKTPANVLINEILQQGGKYLIDCLLYDLYIDDKKLGEDKKALSFRLEFRSDKKTLKDSQIDDVMSKLFKRLENQYGARLR